MHFIAIPNHTPHQFTFGLTPSVHCLASPSGSQTLKGGVNFKAIEGSLPTEKGLFNCPGQGGGGKKTREEGSVLDKGW